MKPFSFYSSLRPQSHILRIICLVATQTSLLAVTLPSGNDVAFSTGCQWISLPGQDTSDSAPSPYLRRQFQLNQPVLRASLKVTARGVYRLMVNGQRVGNEEFLPGWTDYRQRILYHEFEVSSLLSKGENVIAAQLGDGWYAGYLGWEPGRQNYGTTPQLLLELTITTTDGTTERILSDDQWLASEGPIRASDIYHGERYDARLQMPGWMHPDFDSGNWKAVGRTPLDDSTHSITFEKAKHPPVRVIQELQPVDLWQVEPGRWIFDLGQNMVGRARIMVPGIRDQTITLRFAEMLEQDRTLYTANYRHARSTDQYTCRGGEGFETWEPAFTFHGFRYVELSGLPPEARPAINWVTGVVLHSDIKPTGLFNCSDPDLNQLQSNIIWGQKGNFFEVPTDCPQRDERLGWTGDAQVFCPTACFNFDVSAFFHKWMTDMRDAQREDGGIPHVVPNILAAHEFNSPAWADAVVVVPWEVYVRYGDLSILEENFDAMIRWVRYLEANSPGRIRPEKGFGDWLQPYPIDPKNLSGDTERSLIGTAYFSRSTALTAKAARCLDKVETSQQLEQLEHEIAEAFTARFWTDDGQLTSHTQTAYLLALAFDLLPETLRPKALANLVQLIHDADDHLRTGFVGTPLVTQVLTRFGQLDLAYHILLQESYPGWIYSIRQGATTMWERWNSYSHDGGFGDASMNSFNHYAYGAIGQWLYETVAGLQPDPNAPGYRHFFVAPKPGGNLTWAKAELETAHGTIGSQWHLEGSSALVITAQVPPGTSATVVIPQPFRARIIYRGNPLDPGDSGSFELEQGQHTLICTRAN